jgi:methyl-accepting chemotaxis protein
MRNMKLAARIGFGFGLIIAIAVALGAVAILNMVGVQGDARRLDSETVPEVTVANAVERASLLTMYNMRGFALSGNQDYLAAAKTSLADVKARLADARALAEKYPRLSELRGNAGAAQTQVDAYSTLAERTEAAQAELATLRDQQDKDAAAYMTQAQEYLKSMQASLVDDLTAKKAKAAILERAAKIYGINTLIDMGNALRIANAKAQARDDLSILEKGIADFAALDDTVKKLMAITVQQANRDALTALEAAGHDYSDTCSKLLATMTTLAGLNKDRGAAADAVLAASKATSESGLKEAQGVTTVTVARLLSSVIVLVVGLAAAMLIGIALAVAITRAITAPLIRGVSFAKLVASGDFTHHLDIHQKDEIGELADALNRMSDTLRHMVSGVQESAEQVAASSEEITASAQKLAEGAQSQASTLEQTSASVEELTASVDQVAEHAQSQASAVEEGTASMTQTKQAIAGVSSSLGQIESLATTSVQNAMEGSAAVQRVVEGIQRIAESSEKISGIVNVISDIADQTNLLALNASIEAARAGEHGRGFAVVADEVSKLAERSASSTKEIESLIKESARNVTEGVKTATGSQAAMDQIRDASAKVKDMIGSLSESMSQQVTAVEQLSTALSGISEMSQSISAATEEQSTNAKQVSKAVENVNELTQASASAGEEMSAATERLSSMAQELQKLTAQFKITSDGTSAAPSAGGNGHAAIGGNGNGNGNGKAHRPELVAASMH